MLTNCPNDKSKLVEKNGEMACPKCMYSYRIKTAQVKTSPLKIKKLHEDLKKILRESLDLITDEMSLQFMENEALEVVPFYQESYLQEPPMNHSSLRKYQAQYNRMIYCVAKDTQFITPKALEKEGGTVKEGARPWSIWQVFPIMKEVFNPITCKKDKVLSHFGERFIQVWAIKDTSLVHKASEVTFKNIRNETVENFLTRMMKDKGLVLEEGGNKLSYSLEDRKLHVPRIDQYKSVDDFYNDCLKELGHWTGTKLKRDMTAKKDSIEYAIEEMTAEMISAGLCKYLGINVVKRNSDYIYMWLKKVQASPEILVYASKQAEKALEFLTEIEAIN